ncbi:major facilitator superfamily domain-containing protein [Fimicolochytrium jonesii]|uniref:major facilitator superfamily domain-containing protein n=1 Tax=Fimicolochytrium jonesii TaxID=1396493 RepID=UPI0022FDF843|nr:major facilitator superfamily domain-containing protein [Fimicolochytrium jonesii]KAI8821474.1 major facilitator superfamily domain-containing protein [Fimicolochytrium jonesii]
MSQAQKNLSELPYRLSDVESGGKSPSQGADGSRPAVFRNGLHEAQFIACIAASQLLTVGALGNTTFTLNQIAAGVGTSDVASLAWFMAAFSLTGGALVLIAGRIGDMLGHKQVYIAGWLWMALWTFICGASKSESMFITSRAMAGIGAAALGPSSMALLGITYGISPRKNIAFAILGFLAPCGYLFGGVVGAIFATYTTWRWTFYVWGFMCLAVAGSTFFNVPAESSRGDPSDRDFDWAGAILGLTCLILISYAINDAPAKGWDTPYIYILLIMGVLSGALFVYAESKASKPILPMKIWKASGFTPIIICMCFGWASFSIFLWYTTTFLLNFRNLTPLTVAAELVPLMIGGAVATFCVGAFLPRVPAQYVFGVSMTAFFIGCFGMIFVPIEQSYWAAVFILLCLVVFGPDLSFASASIMASNAVAPELQGVAGSMVSTAVLYSLSIGVGLAATVEVQVGDYHGPNPDRLRGYRGAFILGAALAAVAMLVAVFFVRDTRFKR